MVGAGHTVLRLVSFTVTLYVASGVITSLHFFVVRPALLLLAFGYLYGFKLFQNNQRVAGREATEE